MSRYLCPSCGISFEPQGKPRCPSCLRQHGLELQPEALPRRSRTPEQRRRLLAGALLALSLAALAGGGLLLWLRWRTDLPRPGQIGLLSPALLRRTLAARGVPAEHAGSPFASSPSLRRLAGQASGDPLLRARALARRLAAVLSRAEADLSGSAEVQVRTAAELLESLERKPASPVRSLEAAVLAVALLREADLPAVLGVAKRLEAPVRTPAVTPGIGRYLAVVYAPGKLGRDPLLLLDPMRALRLPAWAGGGGDAEMAARVDGFTPLDDGSAAAHLLALRAYVLRQRDPRLAYHLSALALRAAAPAPELHLLRATVLAAAGGTDDALAEARRALALADEPAGRLALAWLLAEAGRLSEALPPLRQAIAQETDYWPARALAAGLEGAIDPKRSEAHLGVARRVAPEEPMVLTAQAASLLGSGEAAAARDLLRRATRGHGGLGSLLLLYRALLKTGDAAEAAGVRRQLLERARADERAALERALEAMEQAARGGEEPAASAPATPPATPRRAPFRLPDVRLGR